MANCVQQGQEKLKLKISTYTLLMCLCAVHVMCDQKNSSSKNEHEWIGAGLKNEVKKKMNEQCLLEQNHINFSLQRKAWPVFWSHSI